MGINHSHFHKSLNKQVLGAAMLIVTGPVTAMRDTIAEMTRAALEYVARSRLEPGCIDYGVRIDAKNPQMSLAGTTRIA